MSEPRSVPKHYLVFITRGHTYSLVTAYFLRKRGSGYSVFITECEQKEEAMPIAFYKVQSAKKNERAYSLL